MGETTHYVLALICTCAFAVADPHNAGHSAGHTDSTNRACSYNRFLPPSPGLHAIDHNGIALQPTCFNTTGELLHHHVFVIGDWGGRLHKNGTRPVPANDTGGTREFVSGPDDWAQHRVAEQMKKRAPHSNPDYVLNVGDNFYWAGIEYNCGTPPFKHIETGQWRIIYEYIYKGAGLDGKQWLGVLGNHDYGGYLFKNAWDQTIGYTWACSVKSSSCRWMTPAQYWSAKVYYTGFSVDYYFVDTNVLNAFDPHQEADHNICSLKHNGKKATCGPQGPTSVSECPEWFNKLWEDQIPWLDEKLSASRATWQVVVTHFPPDFNMEFWGNVSTRWGIDLIVTGHRHNQEVHGPDDDDNFLAPTSWIVSGGGGGITSEYPPDVDGKDDMYGFMDLTLTASTIKIEAISHGGHIRKTATVRPRQAGDALLHPSLSKKQPRLDHEGHTLTPYQQALLHPSTATLAGSIDLLPPGPSPPNFPADLTNVADVGGAIEGNTADPDDGFFEASEDSGPASYASPGGFSLVVGDTCRGAGMLPIRDTGLCEAAAQDLALADVTARDTEASFNRGASRGCYYTDGDGYPSLWVSADPRLTATNAMPMWQAVCRVSKRHVDQDVYDMAPKDDEYSSDELEYRVV